VLTNTSSFPEELAQPQEFSSENLSKTITPKCEIWSSKLTSVSLKHSLRVYKNVEKCMKVEAHNLYNFSLKKNESERTKRIFEPLIDQG
jgi:hypothetical protein